MTILTGKCWVTSRGSSVGAAAILFESSHGCFAGVWRNVLRVVSVQRTESSRDPWVTSPSLTHSRRVVWEHLRRLCVNAIKRSVFSLLQLPGETPALEPGAFCFGRGQKTRQLWGDPKGDEGWRVGGWLSVPFVMSQKVEFHSGGL